MQQHSFFFCPAPGALGRDQKVKYHLFSIRKSVSKIFIVCDLTNKRYNTYQMGFSFRAWVMPKGWGVGVPRGSKNFFFESGHVAYHIDGDDK